MELNQGLRSFIKQLPSEYVANKLARNQALFFIKPDGSSGVIWDGKVITEKELEDLYPLGTEITTSKQSLRDGVRGVKRMKV